MSSNDLPIERIREIYSKYSVKDIAETLFVSSLWLPNISSSVKHLFAASVVVTIAPEDFSPKRQITSFADFEKLLAELICIIPD